MKRGKLYKSEQKKKTNIKTKTATDKSVNGNLFRQPDFHPPATSTNPAAAPAPCKASKKYTRQKIAGVKMPPGVAEKFASIQAIGAKDEISDAKAARRADVEKPNDTDTTGSCSDPETRGTKLVVKEKLPAVVDKDNATESDIEPEWHQVKHLPGYLSSPIRALGRQVFGAFTKTPIEDIHVLADLGGRGPNNMREIDAVAGWLQKNGMKDTHAKMHFQRSIPGYKAELIVYRARGRTFLLVRDFAGKYAYAWPSIDENAVTESDQNRIDAARGSLE